MISKENKKALFVCWMTELGYKDSHVDGLLEYLDTNGLINTGNLVEFLEKKKDIIDADKKHKAEMPVFRKEIANVILTGLSTAPDSQITEQLRRNISVFRQADTTLKEQWDFILSIHSRGTTSDFVKELCNLEPYYKPPTDDNIQP